MLPKGHNRKGSRTRRRTLSANRVDAGEFPKPIRRCRSQTIQSTSKEEPVDTVNTQVKSDQGKSQAVASGTHDNHDNTLPQTAKSSENRQRRREMDSEYVRPMIGSKNNELPGVSDPDGSPPPSIASETSRSSLRSKKKKKGKKGLEYFYPITVRGKKSKPKDDKGGTSKPYKLVVVMPSNTDLDTDAEEDAESHITNTSHIMESACLDIGVVGISIEKAKQSRPKSTRKGQKSTKSIDSSYEMKGTKSNDEETIDGEVLKESEKRAQISKGDAKAGTNESTNVKTKCADVSKGEFRQNRTQQLRAMANRRKSKKTDKAIKERWEHAYDWHSSTRIPEETNRTSNDRALLAIRNSIASLELRTARPKTRNTGSLPTITPRTNKTQLMRENTIGARCAKGKSEPSILPAVSNTKSVRPRSSNFQVCEVEQNQVRPKSSQCQPTNGRSEIQSQSKREVPKSARLCKRGDICLNCVPPIPERFTSAGRKRTLSLLAKVAAIRNGTYQPTKSDIRLAEQLARASAAKSHTSAHPIDTASEAKKTKVKSAQHEQRNHATN